MPNPMLSNRMARELKMLEKSPPEGVCCWPAGDSITNLRAQVMPAHCTDICWPAQLPGRPALTMRHMPT